MTLSIITVLALWVVYCGGFVCGALLAGRSQ